MYVTRTAMKLRGYSRIWKGLEQKSEKVSREVVGLVHQQCDEDMDTRLDLAFACLTFVDVLEDTSRFSR